MAQDKSNPVADGESLRELDEAGLRAARIGFPKSEDDLLAIIRPLVERGHDYGTCVYAMSIAAEATFNYVASVLGCTGFQASCADLDLVRRTRGIEGPFAIFKADNLCYPQYDLPAKFREWMEGEDTAKWVAEECQRMLDEASGVEAPSVVEHWREKAASLPAKGAS